jgi:hypothetical protein
MNQKTVVDKIGESDLDKRIKKWMKSGEGKKAIEKALVESTGILNFLEKERQLDPRSLDEPITL